MRASDEKNVARAIKGILYDELREALAAPQGKSKKSWMQGFVGQMLAEAKKNPNSQLGMLVAKQLMTEDIINKLDAETDRYLARDRDFIRYRLMNTLYKEQRDVFLDNYRNKIIIGSRRIGKTELAARLLLDDMKEANHHAIFISMKFENGIRQCYPIVLELAKLLDFPIERESRSDGEISFTNGSNILFKGNHNREEANKLLGYKFSYAIVDECQNQPGLNYLLDTVLRPALTDYEDSRIVLLGTPPRIPHTAAENIWMTYKNWHHYSWDMTKNPYLKNVDEYIESICRDKGIDENSPFILREMRGQWAYDTEAQVFRGYQTYSERPKWKIDHIIIGNDYGWADYNAIIGVGIDSENRRGYVFYEDKFNKAGVSDIIDSNRKCIEEAQKILIENGSDPSRIKIFGDTSDTIILQEMATKYKLPAFQCWKYDKSEAISQLAEDCRTGKILIPENGVLVDEFQQTLYKRDENDGITNEIDNDLFHPDAVFALLYASRQWNYEWGRPTGDKREATNYWSQGNGI